MVMIVYLISDIYVITRAYGALSMAQNHDISEIVYQAINFRNPPLLKTPDGRFWEFSEKIKPREAIFFVDFGK